MTVRAAKFQDIPAIVGVMADAHERSIYGDHTTFDPIEAKQLLLRSLHRHGQTNYGGTLVMVSETGGEVRGFMLGMLDNVYACLKELMATDLFFIMREGADPRDARTMVLELMRWARLSPKVVEVFLGANSAIVDWTRTAKLYESCGLEQCGGMFRLAIDRSQKEVRNVQSG